MTLKEDDSGKWKHLKGFVSIFYTSVILSLFGKRALSQSEKFFLIPWCSLLLMDMWKPHNVQIYLSFIKKRFLLDWKKESLLYNAEDFNAIASHSELIEFSHVISVSSPPSRANLVCFCCISWTMTIQPLTVQTCTASACDGLNSGRCLSRDKKMVCLTVNRKEREPGPSFLLQRLLGCYRHVTSNDPRSLCDN